jgi:hypothetical protein
MPQITENVLPEAIPELNALLARVSLPSYKLHRGLSQETVAYSSKVALDGKVIGYAMNDGHGGADVIVVEAAHRAEWEQVVRDFSILTGTEDVEPDALLVSVVVEMIAERKMVAKMQKNYPNIAAAVAIETPTELVVIGSYSASDEEVNAEVDRRFAANFPRRIYRSVGSAVASAVVAHRAGK